MGRIAGTPVKVRSAAVWKREAAERQQLNQRAKPAPAVPSAAVRQKALLWAISNQHPDGLIVGARYAPPYTPDMRALVAKGQLSLSRRYVDGKGFNVLRLTDKGSRAAEVSRIDAKGLAYIVNAFATDTLR